jgi:hypothetical protein
MWDWLCAAIRQLLLGSAGGGRLSGDRIISEQLEEWRLPRHRDSLDETLEATIGRGPALDVIYGIHDHVVVSSSGSPD